jgi:hypothetical protein
MTDIVTIKIEDGHNGFIIINATDFAPAIHKKYEVIKKRDEPRKVIETSVRSEIKYDK